MYLSNIKLWNFRKFGNGNKIDLAKPDLNLDLTKGLNVIIGENDSGKTAIIDAIKLVLKTHSYEYIRVEKDDFYSSAERLRVELTFKDLKDEEAKNFVEWLGWEKEENDKVNTFLRLIYDVSRNEDRILPSDVKAGVDEEGYSLDAAAKEYLKVTYLKPLRDAENELIAKKNSRLSQILRGDNAFLGKSKSHQLVDLFKKLSNDLGDYFKTDSDGKIIKKKVDGYIQQFFSSTSSANFSSPPSDLKEILEKLELSLAGEHNPGLGTLNRLFMATELLHLGKDNWTGLRLGLIEELEAHLHPQAQMQVIEALQGNEGIQLILTTHSPNLASKVKLQNLILCHNGQAFPLGKDYTKLDPDDYVFLEKFLDTTKANLFFAKGVIIVEGWAEEILIPCIAKKMGINLTERGVSVVNVGSKAYNRFAKIFLRKNQPDMLVPIAVVTDVDVKEYEIVNDDLVKKDNISADISETIDSIKGKGEAKVKYFAAPRWTFEFSMYHSTKYSERFKDIAQEVHSKSDWSNFEETLARKLLKNNGLKKTEIAYKLSQALESPSEQVSEVQEAAGQVASDETVPDTMDYLENAIRYAAGF